MYTQQLKWITAFVLCLMLTVAIQTGAANATPAQQASVLAVVTNGGATLYSAPDGEAISTLNAGLVVTAVAQNQDRTWTRIETRDKSSGWVESARLIAVGLDTLLQMTPSAATPTIVANTTEPSTQSVPTTSSTTLRTAVVRGSGATLKETPNGKTVDQLRAGTVLTALSAGSAGQWIEVSTDDGQRGWVASAEVLTLQVPTVTPTVAAATAASTPTATAAPTPDYPLATVTELGTQRLNVRSGPAADAPVIAKAGSGDVYPVRARNDAGDWLQLQLNDATNGWGWVTARFVNLDGDMDTLPVSDAVNDDPSGDDAVSTVATVSPTQTQAAALSGQIVIESAGGHIVLIDIALGTVRQFGIEAQATLSPDGSTILAVARFGVQRDLVRIDVAGGATERIDSDGGDANNVSPAWSPDGKSILFLSDRATDQTPSWSFWIMDADGANVRPIQFEGVDLFFGADAAPEVEWK